MKTKTPILPLRGSFPTHTTAPWKPDMGGLPTGAKVDRWMLDLLAGLVGQYWNAVGLPGEPVAPKLPKLPPLGGKRYLPARAEMRLRLAGIAPGEVLWFQCAMFLQSLEVAFDTTYLVRSKPKAGIPDAALKKMAAREGRDVTLAAAPKLPPADVAVAVGTLGDAVELPAKLAKYASRPTFAMPDAVAKKLALDKHLPEGPFPQAAGDLLMPQLGTHVNAQLDDLERRGGVRVKGRVREGVTWGFHSSASLEELVATVLAANYRVIALPRRPPRA